MRRGKQQILDAHGNDPNVTGTGIGFRFRGGHWAGEPVATVMVTNKRPEALIPPALLPKTIEVDGDLWRVDVIQAGPFTLHHQPGRPHKREAGP